MNCSILPLHLHCRGFYNGSEKVNGLSSWKACKIIAPQRKILNVSPGQKTTRCCCLNSLADVDAAVAATSDWVPFIDQVLLLASISLTYMAGVVPLEKSPFNTQTSAPHFDVVPENSSSSGSLPGMIVRGKLMDSLSTIDNGVNPSENIRKFEPNSATQPSSLYDVFEGPRIRLIWRSFQWLEKGVINISANSAAKSANDFLVVFALCAWHGLKRRFASS